jgi:hypothetical protein
MLLTDLSVAEVAGSTDTFRYAVVLTQHVEPPATAPGADLGFGDLSDLNAALAAEAGALVDAMQIPDMLGVPDITDPTPPLTGAIDGVKSALDGLTGAGAALTDLFGAG